MGDAKRKDDAASEIDALKDAVLGAATPEERVRAMKELLEKDTGAFLCSHCGAIRPNYGFNGQRAMLPGMGQVDYVTIFCGECRKLLHIQILNVQPVIAGAGAMPSSFGRTRH